MSESKESGGFFALGLFLGAAVGAAIGLLYAPRPGAQTRRELASRSDELVQKAQEVGSELEARSGGLSPLAREKGGRGQAVPAGDTELPESDRSGEPSPARREDRVDLPPGEDLV